MSDLDLENFEEQESFIPQENAEPVHIEEEKVKSILESLLFASQKPLSMDQIRGLFSGTNIKAPILKRALQEMQVEYAGGDRGFLLEEVGGGYQLRTKQENIQFIRRMIKGRPFKLSGPSLETLSIIAYKQPCIKSEVDQIRGVESGHLVRLLMEKGLVQFAGKSELPGKPMMYKTTRKFLEIFGLRSLKELPSLSEIEELIPEGIGAPEQEKKTLDQLTDDLSLRYGDRDFEAEDELVKINTQLEDISTTTDFFEQEKQRQREQRDREKADDIKERLMLGHEVAPRERSWLERYEAALLGVAAGATAAVLETNQGETEQESAEAKEVRDALASLSTENFESSEEENSEEIFMEEDFTGDDSSEEDYTEEESTEE